MSGFSFWRFLAVLRKEWIQVRRDPITLRMIIALPVMQLFLFGYAINADPRHLPTGLLSADHSAYERSIVAALKNTGYYDIRMLKSEAEAEQGLADGDLLFVINIPPNFARSIDRGEKPAILMDADATDPSAIGNAAAALASLTAALNRDLPPMMQSMPASVPFQFQVHARYNPDQLTVLNIVPGLGDAGAALVSHPDVDAIAFTGGVATGRRVMASAAESLKRVTLELGGKSPNLVFADANLKRTAAGVARSIYRSQGQSCVAGSRLLVDRKISAEFLDLLAAEIPRLKIGDPLADGTEYGPLISGAHRERVHSFVADALANGAKILAGGKTPAEPARGFYYLPTILDGVDANSRAVSEEIFGPVLTVERFDDEEQAIALANATRFGLAAYVWTSNVDRALRVAEKIKTGMVWVNSFFLRDLRVPFGGAKMSGLGRQGGRFSMEFWTEPKLVCVAYGEEDHDG